MKSFLVLSVCLHIVYSVFSRDIPSFVHLCKRNDPELNKCFMRTMNEIRPYLISGIPEMDLPPGEPLYYYDLAATTGLGTATTLEGKSWNQTAEGLMGYDLKNISLDIDNARCAAQIVFPHVRLQGEYKLKGKVLLFEIDSTGHFGINTTELVADVEWIGKQFNKEGNQYINFERVNLKLTPKRASVYFDNLVSGNEDLTKTINQAVNENMDFILEELLPVVAEAFGGLTCQYFNQFFHLFSLKQLFPEN